MPAWYLAAIPSPIYWACARDLDDATQRTAAAAFATYLGGINRALDGGRSFLVGECVSLADICYACELTMLWYERPQRAWLAQRGYAPAVPVDFATRYPRAAAHFSALRAHPAFAPDLETHLTHLENDVLHTTSKPA